MKRVIKPFVNKQLTLPSDTLSLPTVTITGDNRIAIEQQYKLLSFSETEITLQCEKGTLKIEGNQLMIKLMYPREIILEGSIKEVRFQP
ncbi:YabP/YqfC family sporulation protein [Pseudogracilibacillus sp. SE30717A]|uniref:YabP/YqfC family sporulation protein n=1 Tax=Pseudogracilibacillus sp. SE30717A TaxID=3098293 RepID=UPI00300E1488